MENQHTGCVTCFENFTWTINNFSKLDTDGLDSETFFISGHPWQISIFPKWEDIVDQQFRIFLVTNDNVSNLPKNWSKFAKFKLAIINQANSQRTLRGEFEQQFSASEPYCCVYVNLTELNKSGGGFIMNDTFVIEASIAVRKVDFKSFGKIEEVFVPLLEEVCSWHPSLIECQQKRSQVFTALGRVLHFLKTTKMKDINEDACSRGHFQLLWEELETCKFDLTWLEPHVQSVLSMESYIEKFAQLEILEEKVAALDIVTRSLKEKISTLKRDLDAELGYGGPN